jgi:hypothetical protein
MARPRPRESSVNETEAAVAIPGAVHGVVGQDDDVRAGSGERIGGAGEARVRTADGPDCRRSSALPAATPTFSSISRMSLTALSLGQPLGNCAPDRPAPKIAALDMRLL